MKNILIIGGGYAGIAAAKKLAKRFKKDNEVSITLIDKHPFHTLMTELHEVAGHRVEPDSVRVPYAKIFGVSKVQVRMDAIASVDFTKKEAKSKTAVYPYDYLVLGAGAEPEFFGIPGIKENSFTLWSFDDAMKLRFHVDDVFEKAVAEPDVEKRREMLSFVVAGAGFTGVEMAGELLEWRDAMSAKWLIDPKEVRIVIIEAMPSILPFFEEDLRDKIAAYLKKHDVELLTGTAITGAEPGIVKLKNGDSIQTDTFIWTAGVSGNKFVDSLGLSTGPFGKNPEPGKSNRRGRLLVTNEMRSVDYPDVFPVGDNLWFIEDEKPLPQIVETALQTGICAAENIIADIEKNEKYPHKKFKSDYHGFMVSVGGKYAVSNAMNIKMSGIFAQAMKHFVNLHYLIGVAGINQCWEYIKHEFLDRKDQRSFIRGFGAYKTRGYWLLPLRLWLGLMWVFEGINKIGEGWLSWASGTKSAWMFSPWVTQSGVVDAVSAASGAAEAVTAASGATAVSAASGAAETVTAASGAASTAASQFETIWDFTKPIFNGDGVIATWFRETFMDGIMSYIPFQGFQLFVVLFEMALGLCLIGGLFTWWAAAFSIVMCLMFTFTGMFEWYKVWFIFAGFLFLGGGGRAFGLDCWVVPLFKKWWNGTKLARRLYLYFGNPSKKKE